MNTSQLSAAIPRLGRYELDPAASGITFRTDHLFGLAPVRGTLAFRQGSVTVAEPLAASSACVQIDSASFRTPNAQRDRAVRSAKFLDAGRYPVITFRLSGVDTADRTVAGTLTVRDITRPVRLIAGEIDASGDAFALRATARIDRTDFGITAARGLAGRFLRIQLEIRCVRT